MAAEGHRGAAEAISGTRRARCRRAGAVVAAAAVDEQVSEDPAVGAALVAVAEAAGRRAAGVEEDVEAMAVEKEVAVVDESSSDPTATRGGWSGSRRGGSGPGLRGCGPRVDGYISFYILQERIFFAILEAAAPYYDCPLPGDCSSTARHTHRSQLVVVRSTSSAGLEQRVDRPRPAELAFSAELRQPRGIGHYRTATPSSRGPTV